MVRRQSELSACLWKITNHAARNLTTKSKARCKKIYGVTILLCVVYMAQVMAENTNQKRCPLLRVRLAWASRTRPYLGTATPVPEPHRPHRERWVIARPVLHCNLLPWGETTSYELPHENPYLQWKWCFPDGNGPHKSRCWANREYPIGDKVPGQAPVLTSKWCISNMNKSTWSLTITDTLRNIDCHIHTSEWIKHSKYDNICITFDWTGQFRNYGSEMTSELQK